MNTSSEIIDETKLESLMSKAEICQGSQGPFAYIKGIAEWGARGTWGRTDAEAIALLRVNVRANFAILVEKWESQFEAL